MKASTLSALAASLLLAATAFHGAQAQTSTGKMVTRDELRVCMNSEGDLADRRKALEGRVAKNKAEADAILAERAELSEEQKTMEEANETKRDRFARKVKAHNVKVAAAKANADAFNADLDTLNKDVVAYNGKCGGITFSSEDKAAILKEREAAGKK